MSMPGSFIASVPYGQGFALFITDPNGGIYTIGGDPQGFGRWSNVPGIRFFSMGNEPPMNAKPGSPVTAVRYGQGLALFVADSNGVIYATSSRFPEYMIDGRLDVSM
jgi:hypothetical protein